MTEQVLLKLIEAGPLGILVIVVVVESWCLYSLACRAIRAQEVIASCLGTALEKVAGSLTALAQAAKDMVDVQKGGY